MKPVLPVHRAQCRKVRAFTLLELLVVIAIIGILAGLAGPAISNMRKGDAMSAGARQILDDIAYARQRAISDHTLVYLVFIPSTANTCPAPGNPPLTTSLAVREQERFLQGQLNSYALFVKRQAGDQPGRGTQRYITSWRTLPEGIVIAPEKFAQLGNPPNTFPATIASLNGNYRSFDYAFFPFPDTNRPLAYLPYLAFDYVGSLKSGTNITAVIPLARGSLMTSRTTWSPADFLEQPPGNSTNAYNQIVIDRLTGRARHETVRIQ